MSKTNDGVQRDPIDRTAAMILGKGVAPPAVKITCDHWEIRPQLKKHVSKDCDITGTRQGRLVAIGMHHDRNDRWVVRCDCGSFELRTARAMKNPANSADKCVKCRRLDQAKRHHEFATTGRNRESLPSRIK